jgi:sphingosine kinase
MSQALGLVADMDIGTEAFRWMGDTRFYLGFLRGLIANAACPVRVAIKVAEADKRAMVRACDAARAQAAPAVDDAEPETEALPALQYDFKSSDGWIEFERPLLYFYAGQGPYVGRCGSRHSPGPAAC